MTESVRLPARLEVQGLIRRVQFAGGFAAVLRKGHDEAGAILLIAVENGRNPRFWERIPQLDGSRQWSDVTPQGIEDPEKASQTIERRSRSDPDLWIVELDIADAERLIVSTGV